MKNGAALQEQANKIAWVNRPTFVLFIAALISILSLSMDIFLPVFPEIADEFALGRAEYTRSILTVFVFALGAGQLFFGILADRFGRRPVLLATLAVYGLAAIYCTIATSFSALLAARFVQGFAAAGPRVIAIAILRDTRSGIDFAKTMSFTIMIFMMAPIFAPFLGQAIALISGWRAISMVLFIMSLILWFITVFKLPETCAPDARTALNGSNIKINLKRIIFTRVTMGNTVISVLAYGAMFGFITIAPIIYADLYDIKNGFSVYFATFGISIAIAAFINTRMLSRYGPALILRAGLVLLLISTAFLTVITTYQQPPFWVFQSIMMIAMFSKGLIIANCNALALEPHGQIAGFASAFIGALTMLGSATIGHVIGGQFDGTIWPIALSYVLISALMLMVSTLTNRN